MGASPHAFAVVRGRGYRPEQVDRRMARLIERTERDWERVAELTLLVQQMTGEAEQLRSMVANMPPQTYESLGERARKLLTLAEGEAEQLRADSEAQARRCLEQAESASGALRESAHHEAERVREEAAAAAVRSVEAARAEADALRVAAHAAADEARSAAGETLREVSRHCAESVAGQERAQVQAWEDAERELEQRERAFEAYVEELAERGERALTVARSERMDAEEAARRWQEEASARGGELLAAARVQEKEIERETERVQWEHAERAELMRRHMARVRSTLASLTGRAAEEGEYEAETSQASQDHVPEQSHGHGHGEGGQEQGQGQGQSQSRG
ncbi:MAG TPA: cellulose-binding protein, partial [Streptomyces sp.]|nr:cellulose-binding protein [Streptomyces sp.]